MTFQPTYMGDSVSQWGYNKVRAMYPREMGGPLGNKYTSLPSLTSFGRRMSRQMTPNGIMTYFGKTRSPKYKHGKIIMTNFGKYPQCSDTPEKFNHGKVLRLRRYGKCPRCSECTPEVKFKHGKVIRLRYGKTCTPKPMKFKFAKVLPLNYGKRSKKKGRKSKRKSRRTRRVRRYSKVIRFRRR